MTDERSVESSWRKPTRTRSNVEAHRSAIQPRAAVWSARAVLLLVVALSLMPLIYQVGISFKQPRDVFSNPAIPFVLPLSLDNYIVVLRQFDFPRFLFNSLVFALGVTLGQQLLAVPAAFAFSYFQFPGRNVLLGSVLLSLSVPFVVTYIPNYLMLAGWKMIGTLHGMILPMLGVSLGFGIFLLRQQFMSFPRAVLEAAVMDGAHSWQILWRVLIPVHLPAMLSVAIYTLINTWNQLVWPTLVGAGKPENYTLTVAVQAFFTSPEGGDYWGAIMAASVLTSLPTVFIFLIMRKQVLKTFIDGAVKG